MWLAANVSYESNKQCFSILLKGPFALRLHSAVHIAYDSSLLKQYERSRLLQIYVQTHRLGKHTHRQHQRLRTYLPFALSRREKQSFHSKLCASINVHTKTLQIVIPVSLTYPEWRFCTEGSGKLK
jgi:hypothetical protein